MKIHVAIVSDQILANLIPALMDRPEMVYLVCSASMAQRQAEQRLASLLKREAIAVNVKYEAPDVGLKQIHEFALELVEEIKTEHPDAQIVLNATGGTKLMAMGFVDMFRGDAARIIYTDTAHGRIEILPDKKQAAADPEPMRDVLNVNSYLAAQGFRVSSAVSDDETWREQAAARKAACKYLGRHAAGIQDFIGAMNALADRALEKVPDTDEERLAQPRQIFNNTPWGDWAKALGELAKARLIDWRDGESEIEFRDATAALFLRGGWLEEYAWHIVKDEGVYDARMGVSGRWDNTQNGENEFDVLACNGNQLLYIECKTLRYRDGNDNEIAYKVDSLGQDVRGLFGQTWLLSAREPSQVLSDRAKKAGICLIGPQALPRLKENVREWIGNRP